MKEISLKLRNFVMLLCIGIISAPLFTACSDDDEEASSALIGYWVDQDQPNGGWANTIDFCIRKGFSAPHEIGSYYQYMNENTVKYGFIDAYDSYRSDAFTTVNVRGRTYYLVIEPSNSTNTYYVIGNKIYFSTGQIFTLMDGLLYKDGGSTVYTKINTD